MIGSQLGPSRVLEKTADALEAAHDQGSRP